MHALTLTNTRAMTQTTSTPNDATSASGGMVSAMANYSAPQVAAVLGLTYWQLYLAEKRGMIPPARRIGRNRCYGGWELPDLARQFSEAGYAVRMPRLEASN